MTGRAIDRTAAAHEPFPWFVLVLIALAAVSLVATSAARIFRYDAADAVREERFRTAHEVLIREAAEYARQE